MDDTKSVFGERISTLLRKNNLTQRQLAEKVGVTEASMTRYIKGDRVPNGKIVANIAVALHTTSEYLLGMKTVDGNTCTAYKYDIFNDIVEALQKQIPIQTIVKVNDEAIVHYCHVCKTEVSSTNKYCGTCGQAIIY